MPLGREAIFAALLTSLIATSAFIGVMNFSYKYNALPDFLAPSLPDQISVNPQGIETTSGQNFTSASTWSQNNTVITGTWTQTANGLKSTGITPISGDATLAIKNIQSNNGVYTVGYSVLDDTCTGGSACVPWGIFIRHNINTGEKVNDLTLIVGQSGLDLYQGSYCYDIVTCLISGPMPTPIQHSNVPGISSTHQLTTVLNENTHTLAVYNYGNQIMYVQVPAKIIDPTGSLVYAGIRSRSNGFTVENIDANIAAPATASGTATDEGILGSIFGGLSWITNVLNILIVMAGFTGGALIPGWLTLIIIIPQTLTLALIGAELARGN